MCLFIGRPWDPPDIFKHAQFGPDCTGTPDTFELVPYEVRTFWKWAVGILLECLPSATVVAEKLCFHRCLSVHGGEEEVHTPSWADTPAPQADGHCRGRYASYWNALLLLLWLDYSKSVCCTVLPAGSPHRMVSSNWSHTLLHVQIEIRLHRAGYGNSPVQVSPRTFSPLLPTFESFVALVLVIHNVQFSHCSLPGSEFIKTSSRA